MRDACHLKNQNTTLHTPATLNLAQEFDASVDDVLKNWFGQLTDTQISWIRLPTRKGGCGSQIPFQQAQPLTKAQMNKLLPFMTSEMYFEVVGPS